VIPARSRTWLTVSGDTLRSELAVTIGDEQYDDVCELKLPPMIVGWNAGDLATMRELVIEAPDALSTPAKTTHYWQERLNPRERDGLRKLYPHVETFLRELVKLGPKATEKQLRAFWEKLNTDARQGLRWTYGHGGSQGWLDDFGNATEAPPALQKAAQVALGAAAVALPPIFGPALAVEKASEKITNAVLTGKGLAPALAQGALAELNAQAHTNLGELVSKLKSTATTLGKVSNLQNVATKLQQPVALAKARAKGIEPKRLLDTAAAVQAVHKLVASDYLKQNGHDALAKITDAQALALLRRVNPKLTLESAKKQLGNYLYLKVSK
jgi:hypothetical protein